jgi:hypothetical protein
MAPALGSIASDGDASPVRRLIRLAKVTGFVTRDLRSALRPRAGSCWPQHRPALGALERRKRGWTFGPHPTPAASRARRTSRSRASDSAPRSSPPAVVRQRGEPWGLGRGTGQRARHRGISASHEVATTNAKPGALYRTGLPDTQRSLAARPDLNVAGSSHARRLYRRSGSSREQKVGNSGLIVAGD